MHQFSHHVDFFKVVDVWRLQYVQSREHVFMFEEAQHLQFPEYPLARNKVLEDIGHLFQSDSLSISGICYRPDDPKRPVSDGPVRLYVQLWLQMVWELLLLLMVVVLVVMSLDSGSSLNLCRGCSRRWPGCLSRRWGGEVGLLLAGVEHHRRRSSSRSRGVLLLDRVHGCS